MDGILVYNKEKNISSFKAIQNLKNKLNLPKSTKIGHAGTLDPNSTGLLLVCIGNATKISNYLMNSKKKYLAKAILGIRKDTFDIEGTSILSSDIVPSKEDLLKVTSKYKGNILQVPPMYSAIKHKGKPLYEYARLGKNINLNKRNINIYEFKFIYYEYPYFEFSITCSKGTYIRSIVDEIGFELGSYAYLAELKREEIGFFNIKEAYSIDDIINEKSLNNLSKDEKAKNKLKLYSIDEVILKLLPYYIIERNLALKIANGYKLNLLDLKNIINIYKEIPKEFALFVNIDNNLKLNSILTLNIKDIEDLFTITNDFKIVESTRVFNYKLWL
jgi:tRNA pseudouridine55 synthase